MTINARYVHTNLIARDWRGLARFYQEVLGCVPVPPERDLSGPDMDAGTGIPGAHLRGMHLRLPGRGDDGPTLEIFTYNVLLERPGDRRQPPRLRSHRLQRGGCGSRAGRSPGRGRQAGRRGGDSDPVERRAGHLVLRDRSGRQCHRTASVGKPDIMNTIFAPIVKRFSGFADLYDRYRPPPTPARRGAQCRGHCPGSMNAV